MPSRAPRSSSVTSGASWSPSPRTSSTSRPPVSNRHWPRPAASSATWRPDWPAGAVAARHQVEVEIEKILGPRWVRRVISTTLVGTDPSELRLTWRSDARAKAALADEVFGKRVIFTDRDEWSIDDVVAGYRSQSEAEADFRQMKDRRVVSFSPMFHWTDQKIRVHVLYCVLALVVARLMRRETERAGSPMSVRALLSSLAGIQETLLLYQGERGLPRPAHAHRDGRHPKTPQRPVRAGRLRPHSLSWVLRPPSHIFIDDWENDASRLRKASS